MGTSYGQQAEEDMWAGAASGERSPVPSDLKGQQAGSVPLASKAQVDYLNDLRAKKDLSSLTREQVQWLAEVDFAQIPRKRASDVISNLRRLPKRQNQPTEALGKRELTWAEIIWKLPAGRYAVNNPEGELRFYQCWQSKKDEMVKRIYVMHGPYESKLPMPVQVSIAQAILAVGPRECAIRYGMEIGECSNCGRRLTNRISRELGIGPVCGGRMFGDEFKPMVTAKRAEIVKRGEDPDEELE